MKFLKLAPAVAGAVLGLLFVASGIVVLFGLAPTPTLIEGSPPALFMEAFAPTGYLAFVKVCEVLGGILVAIPRTRNLGLIILGPIVVNILAFHLFITAGEGLLNPVVLVVVLLPLYLLWVERRAFGALLSPHRGTARIA